MVSNLRLVDLQLLMFNGFHYFSVLIECSYRDQKYLPPNYYNLDASSQAKLFAAYLALVGFLLAAMTSNNQRRKSPAQLKNEQHHGEYLISNNEGDLWDQFHQAGLLLEDDDERDF
jgi:hypothetical protein